MQLRDRMGDSGSRKKPPVPTGDANEGWGGRGPTQMVGRLWEPRLSLLG